jgi:predicted MPP superfamily phosphohydrolase
MWLRALGLLLLPLGFLGWGYANAVRDPVMRTASFAFQDWPTGARPIRVALIADPHLQGPDMPPARIARIAAQVALQKPDLILLAGDFVGDRALGTRIYSDAEIAAALRHFQAPLGTWAVLGNHDHWRDGASMRRALEAAGIPVLDNRAIRLGPLTLAGAGDQHTGHADIAALSRSVARLPGPTLLFAHSPDVVPRLPPRFGLVLAGHTHCGQIVLPLIGAIASSSNYGERYRCGIVREPGRITLAAAGLGASVLPLRYGAVPDWWMVTLGPVPRR